MSGTRGTHLRLHGLGAAMTAGALLTSLLASLLSSGTVHASGYHNVWMRSPGTASKLIFRQMPSSSATADTVLTTQPQVAVTTSSGIIVPGRTDSILLEAFTDSGCTTAAGGTLSATINPLNAAGGNAVFAGVKYSAGAAIYLKASASGLTSACSSGIVVSAAAGPLPSAPAPQKLVLSGSTSIPTSTCSAYTVSLQDVYGRPAAATSNVTVALSGAGSGTFYSNSGCTSSITTTSIASGVGQTTVYYKNPSVQTVVLSASDQAGQIDTSTLAVTTSGTKLVLSGNQSMVSTQSCGASPTTYTIEHLNGDGTPASGTVTVTISGYEAGSGGSASAIYSSSGCTGGSKITAPVSVTGSYTFYFKPSSTTPGFFTFSATATGPLPGTLPVAVYLVGSPTVSLSGPARIPTNTCQSYAAVTDRGMPIDTVVTLTSSGSSLTYSDPACTIPSATVTIPAGTAQAPFYIKDTVEEGIELIPSGTGFSGNYSNIVFFGNTSAKANAVSVGNYSCALLDDGTIKCWGANNYGQLGNGTWTSSGIPTRVKGITTAVAVDVGGTHACAVLASGSVKCWGNNSNGQFGNGASGTSSSFPVSVSGITTATQVIAKNLFSCALLSDGSVKCWGYNNAGQLGNGNTSPSTTPVSVSGITTAVEISGSQGNSVCARLSSGSIKCWGSNFYGQLGDTTTNNSSSPVDVSGISTATQISVSGYGHSCARLNDGSMKCWGRNYYGQLGTGSSNTVANPTPVSVTVVATATQIAVGDEHTCALLSDKTIKCWGANSNGALGNGNFATQLNAVSVVGVSTAESISAGYRNTCAVLTGGTLYCWGMDIVGELGVITTGSDANMPKRVYGINLQPSHSAGAWHACAVMNDGTVKCWGKNDYGQLGNGTSGASFYSDTPVTVSGLTYATEIVSGSVLSCALFADGSVKCWGQVGITGTANLGNGTTTGSTTPVSASGISKAIALSAGLWETCALLIDRTVVCWGLNSNGGVGDGTILERTVPTAVSGLTTATSISVGDHACATLLDGSISCWGSNSTAQLGTGSNSPSYSATPVTVSGVTNPTQVMAGYEHTCAILSDATVKCWGKNDFGQIGNGTVNAYTATPSVVTGLSGAARLSGRVGFNCASLNDGSVKCWGNNNNSVLGDGSRTSSSVPVSVSTISSATSVSAGYDSVCARLANGMIYCWGYDGWAMGHGEGKGRVTPNTVWNVSGVTEVSTGWYHGCARMSNSTVKCWGSSGGLGDGSTSFSSTPVLVSGISNAVKTCSGNDGGTGGHSCAVLSDNTIKCWGSGTLGQLGNGGSSNSLSPVTVSGISTATDVACGNQSTCARLSDGTVRCWGMGTSGQLGNSASSNSSTPVTVTGISTATSVSVGNGAACARLSDSTLRCWGYNTYSQLGNGLTSDSNVPVTVSGVSTATAVSIGYDTACAILSDGSVKCWGSGGSSYPTLGNGTTGNSTTPVTALGVANAVSLAVGFTHVCAAQGDGKVYCWGDNRDCELGNCSSQSSAVPLQIKDVSSATRAGAGHYQSCALVSDGTVKCWGARGNQLGSFYNNGWIYHVPNYVFFIP